MTIKQYVNLPIDYDENHGRRLKLEVEASELTEADIQRTEWWIEPHADNHEKNYLSRFQRCRLRWPNTRNRNDKFNNFLELPHVGGDKYVVKCSKRDDRSSPVELEEIETWRKVFYTVHCMNNDCKTTFNSLKDRFEAAFLDGFLELDNRAIDDTLVDEEHTLSSNALTHLYRRRPRLADRPFHLRLVVLNNVYEPEANEYEETTTDGVFTHQVDGYLVPNRPIRTIQARPADHHGWRTVTRNTTVTSDDELTIRLEDNSAIKRALDAGKDIVVRIRVRERGDYLGHSIGNFCCVRIDEEGTPAERATTILQTLTHEIGHSCQQVVRSERRYDDDGNPTSPVERNAMWHTDNEGGQGPHCKTNAHLISNIAANGDELEDTTSGNHWDWLSGTLCTLYYRDHDEVDADGKFCDSCKPLLARTNLGARKMRLEGWNRY